MNTCQSQPRKSPFSRGSSASHRIMTAQNRCCTFENRNNERRIHITLFMSAFLQITRSFAALLPHGRLGFFLAADGDQHLKVEKTRTAESTQIRFIRPNATQSGYSIHCNRFTARQFLPFGAGLLRRWTITALGYYGAGLLRRWAITTLDHCESVQVLDFGNGSAIRFAVDSSMQVTEWVRFHRFQHPSEHDGDVVTPTC